MKLDKDTVESLTVLRSLSKQFYDNKISIEEFFQKSEIELGSTFDFGVDFTVEDLPNNFSKAIKDEIMFYFKYTTYDTEDEKCVIPTNPKWIYGKSNEPFGWIDEDKYRKVYGENFNKLVLEKLE